MRPIAVHHPLSRTRTNTAAAANLQDRTYDAALHIPGRRAHPKGSPTTKDAVQGAGRRWVGQARSVALVCKRQGPGGEAKAGTAASGFQLRSLWNPLGGGSKLLHCHAHHFHITRTAALTRRGRRRRERPRPPRRRPAGCPPPRTPPSPGQPLSPPSHRRPPASRGTHAGVFCRATCRVFETTGRRSCVSLGSACRRQSAPQQGAVAVASLLLQAEVTAMLAEQGPGG